MFGIKPKPVPVMLLERQGYEAIRQLPTGEWAGLKNFIYDWAVCVGLKPYDGGWTAMFYFHTRTDARRALSQWDGRGFPPGYVPW